MPYRKQSLTVGGVKAASAPRDPFTALGDPTRRAIVELLKPGPRSVREISDDLPVSRPAVSQHLRVLREAGLVSEQRVGTRRLYRLDDMGVADARAYLERVWGEATARFRITAENTRERR